MEVALYPVYDSPKTRGKRRRPTTDTQEQLNQHHAEGRLRRLLNTNFTEQDIFITLTYDEAHLPATVEAAQRTLQNFLRRAKRLFIKRGKELRYVAVIEQGEEHDRLHIHLVLGEGLTRGELDKCWGLGTVRSKALTFGGDGLVVWLGIWSGDRPKE